MTTGMPNLHSHAFQRILVGRTQDTVPGDDFWTWRTRMYEAVASLSLDTLQSASAWLFAELVASGYTSVVEFHYIHRPGGAAPHEASECILRAAKTAGIRVTLAPVLYRWGGFERNPLRGPQGVFDLTRQQYADLFRGLESTVGNDVDAALACAPHSLRAVDEGDLDFVLDLVGDHTPVHIHVSEQRSEVQGAIEHLGATPLEWLMNNIDVNSRWGLVHCTQATPDELAAVRSTGATTILCPTTEHDLGDGRFPFETHKNANWGIGSDSQVSTSPMEELRLILYGMRAATGRRAVSDQLARPAGSALWQESAESKERVLGQRVGRLETGYMADLAVLDASAPLFCGLSPDQMLSALVLSGDRTLLSEVVVGGRLMAKSGRHVRHDSIADGWRQAIMNVADSSRS